MSKKGSGKSERGNKSNPAPTPHASMMADDATAAGSHSEDDSAGGITNQNLFDMLQKISEEMKDLKTIKQSITSVETKISDFGARITEVEERVGGLEDAMAERQQNPAITKQDWEILRDRIATLEDRSRRTNLRFVGFLEGVERGDPVGFLDGFLTTTLGNPSHGGGYDLQRVHRIERRPRPGAASAAGGSRTIIANFLRFQDCQAILRAAREKKRIEWEGKPVMIFADYSPETQRKREGFKACKKLLHERKKSFRLMYPAILRIDMDVGPPKIFSDPQTAMDFIQTW